MSEDLAAPADDATAAATEEPAQPRADLKILESRVYRGPNYWSYDEVDQQVDGPMKAATFCAPASMMASSTAFAALSPKS